ncbi:MAG: homocysteine S-methyltransferase [Flavobacteriales bacterium]|nr:homocysteine S-methyltransferase [Flavobacteriales bacterium]MCX7769325.1 homocysteine S-methyltransferase [Flavobacteriales bacterium]MDW8410732.1 homocysteine S-methyltransferase [Flavobacteriales bacterium]
MDPLSAALSQRPVLILDGALATELERRGCHIADPLWSAKILLEQPELIQAIHYEYFEAGADVAITASYQATIPGFMRRGLSEREAVELIQRSVTLAREARDRFWSLQGLASGRMRPLVAASIGPYGAFLHDGSEYRGNYGLSAKALKEFHRPRMAALLAAAPDLLACETIPCLEEACTLTELLEEFPGAVAYMSFSARDGGHTAQGEPIAQAVAAVASHPQVVAVGVNCTAPRFIQELIGHIRSVTDKPIVVYPNSGETYDPLRQSWIGRSESACLATYAPDWFHAGARLIGGCCRTSPQDIKALAAWARSSFQ